MSTDAEQAPGGGSGRRIRIPQAPPPEPPPVDESVDEADIEQETAPVEQEPAQAGREREAAAEREREETAEREREAAAKRQREEAKREREEAKRQRAEEAKREREEAKRKRSEPRAKRRAELPAQVYKDERPAEEFAAYHERVRAGGPEWIYDVVRLGVTLVALIVFRARAYGSDNVPNGPVILAPNHGSFFDHFLTGAFVRRHVQFMAKSHMFQKRRLSTWIYTHGGVFPVRRGSRDEEAMLTARKVLERGGCLGMYV
ncbi:MAG: 1-acyl-sn-glycerol-3-phosphate acyltransferase, partial [Solirubrobacterales bacterium]|nr:1-acyl-sn-glycerol-3-phosphate acyltransferase [Solirubrobacterales bacterium]